MAKYFMVPCKRRAPIPLKKLKYTIVPVLSTVKMWSNLTSGSEEVFHGNPGIIQGFSSQSPGMGHHVQPSWDPKHCL